MPVISTTQDQDTLTLTLTADLAADPDRAWQLWADPRQLERWWGPPTWPATFVEHSLSVGAECRYFMSGPEGERAHGWWRIRSADEPKALEFDEGFSDAEGRSDDAMPTMTIVASSATSAGAVSDGLTATQRSAPQRQCSRF